MGGILNGKTTTSTMRAASMFHRVYMWPAHKHTHTMLLHLSGGRYGNMILLNKLNSLENGNWPTKLLLIETQQLGRWLSISSWLTFRIAKLATLEVSKFSWWPPLG